MRDRVTLALEFLNRVGGAGRLAFFFSFEGREKSPSDRSFLWLCFPLTCDDKKACDLRQRPHEPESVYAVREDGWVLRYRQESEWAGDQRCRGLFFFRPRLLALARLPLALFSRATILRFRRVERSNVSRMEAVQTRGASVSKKIGPGELPTHLQSARVAHQGDSTFFSQQARNLLTTGLGNR